jgi:modification methylase
LKCPQREGNLWSSSSSYLPESQFNHPTQKPEAIISRMILNSSDPGDVIIDLHCGSGTTAACAKKLARNFLCCDIQQKYVDLARRRVAMTQPPLPLEFTPSQVEMFT